MENRIEKLLKAKLSPERYEEMEGIDREFTQYCGEYTKLDSLVNTGYLTPEEAKSLQEPLQELPKGKKLLIACYVQYSKAIAYSKAISNLDYINDIHTANRKRDLSAMAEGNKRLIEVLGFEEAKNLLHEWEDALVSSVKDIVTTFVCEKRRSIRAEVKKVLFLLMALELSDEVVKDEQTGETLDSIPYLRAMAKKNGYREKAKSLNEEDRKALSLCADYYLDLLEVLHLNGEEEKRREEYKSLCDEEGYLKEDFTYRDQADEALIVFSCIANMQSRIYDLALLGLGDLKLKGVSVKYTNLCKEIISQRLTPEDLVVGRVLNTKFREYALSLYDEKRLKAKLSPEIIQKWEKFLNGANKEKKASAKKRTTTKRTKSE